MKEKETQSKCLNYSLSTQERLEDIEQQMSFKVLTFLIDREDNFVIKITALKRAIMLLNLGVIDNDDFLLNILIRRYDIRFKYLAARYCSNIAELKNLDLSDYDDKLKEIIKLRIQDLKILNDKFYSGDHNSEQFKSYLQELSLPSSLLNLSLNFDNDEIGSKILDRILVLGTSDLSKGWFSKIEIDEIVKFMSINALNWKLRFKSLEKNYKNDVNCIERASVSDKDYRVRLCTLEYVSCKREYLLRIASTDEHKKVRRLSGSLIEFKIDVEYVLLHEKNIRNRINLYWILYFKKLK